MAAKGLTSGQFSEELYFMLMSSPVRHRVRNLGEKHGITGKALRNHILAFGDKIGDTADFSMKDTVYMPNKRTG